MERNMKARSWCFTINNDTDDDLDKILNAEFKYCIFGFEVGEKGTPHIQGFISFENPRHLNGVKTILPRAHLSIARGSVDQNITYCSKDGEVYEFGEKPSPGKRSDITEIKRLIDEGATMEYIMDEYPSDYIRYYKGFEKIRSVKNKFLDKEREVNYVKYKDFSLDNYDDYFVCNSPGQLNNYDNEHYLIIWNSKAFSTYDLELLTMGLPLHTNTKSVSPKSVVIIN